MNGLTRKSGVLVLVSAVLASVMVPAALAQDDNTAPVVFCPDNIQVEAAPGASTAVVNYPDVTAADEEGGSGLADGSPYLASGLASGADFPIGDNTVKWEARDNSNNGAFCEFIVTVEAVEAPPPPSTTADPCDDDDGGSGLMYKLFGIRAATGDVEKQGGGKRPGCGGKRRSSTSSAMGTARSSMTTL